MNFRTTFNIAKQDKSIDLGSGVLLIGSCFTEHIGNKLNYHKIDTLINPFGTLFHPLAITHCFKQAIEQQVIKCSELHTHQDIWFHYQYHSQFNNHHQTEVVNNINSSLSKTLDYLKSASHIVITLGTAWAYFHKELKQYVANCHKTPQKHFDKTLLDQKTIVESLNKSIALIKSINKSATIIFTLSPVRHIKDGMVENMQSKSRLHSAIQDVLSEDVKYFPSYEIMMDDLRDYRFYKSDLIHPNETAVDYIWQQFKNSWIDASIWPVLDEIDTIQKGLAHKAFNPESDAHQTFLKQLQKKIEGISIRYPSIKF